MSLSRRVKKLEKYIRIDQDERLLIIKSYGEEIREQGEDETVQEYTEYLDSIGIKYLLLNF
ncbi:hypothetical protein DXT76_19555 [Halobacillus trueperi]|uniref:Uncharacterized protein n=1 Tax=Halobacillus trueperi TaxID=156205 RepID=A0A3D8VCY0_9BACI|nr:hypothetical protein [Halobacillus trueperi]RDY67292.1 hypothetical protein DXT76_19555 [Halobacillus trueperi]